ARNSDIIVTATLSYSLSNEFQNSPSLYLSARLSRRESFFASPDREENMEEQGHVGEVIEPAEPSISSSRNQKKGGKRNVVALTGGAAVLVLAANLAIYAFNCHRKRQSKKKCLRGSSVRVNLPASEILKLADRIIAKSKRVHDAVASVPLDKVTYENTIAPLADLEAEQFPLVQSCVFPKLVYASEGIQKASVEAERRIDAHVLACRQREDLYRVVKAVSAKGEWKNPEGKQYIKCLVREFERNGLNLTVSKREEVQRLRAKIDELSLRYIQNLQDDDTCLLLSETELEGLPSEYLKSLEKDASGKYKLYMRSNHVVAALELCKVGQTRKRIAIAYGKRCGHINLSVLESLVELRHKYARLLGHSNFAEYAVDLRMAKTPTKVFEFLEDISASLTNLATRELSVLKDLKKEEGDFTFAIEDLLYYVKRAEAYQFDLDFKALKQFFPVDLVLSGIFKIIQDLFGLRFEEIKDTEVWHPDVSVFSAHDLSSGELLGHFYLDLYTRKGKYGHTCVLALQNGALPHNGTRQISVALLISRLHKGGDQDPCLMRFSEVVSLFHEFGHVVQHICNRAPFTKLSGMCVDPDFVELPALLLENWCYEISTLKLISGFHQDITVPIKDETCKSLKRWRYSFSALKLKQDILYCLFDQIIHSADNVDIVELFKHLHPKVMLGLPMLEGTNPASCFPRSAIGHEAACYSRIWSEVFAADIFATKFRNDNLLNHQVGIQFRNKVLAPGGSRDPIELLTEFLGREPSIQAFIDSRSEHTF
ncbi:Probable thimet oligopeptidase, partial [Linum grandiflorum]